MPTRWITIWAAAAWIVGTVGLALAEEAPSVTSPLQQRWVYLQLNLQVDEVAEQAIAIARRAASAGYNGVVLADFKLNVLDRVPERYFRNVAKFKAVCDEHRLEVVPCVAPFGYSEGILLHDPNLAEGLPAKDMALVVQDGVARAVQSPHSRIRGDFEEARGDQFTGWGFQDEPGRGTFRDTEVRHGGASSLRIENPGGVRDVNRRVSKKISVPPFSQWHLSVWIKTDDFDAHGSTRLFALGADGRVLAHQNLGVKRTQDWTRHEVMLNTLENTEVGLYCGVWGARAGRLWIDDLAVIPAPLVNVVRRVGCPLTLRTKEGRELREGVDFENVSDEKMVKAMAGGRFDIYHEPPTIRLMPSARVASGDTLRASYFHAVSIYDGQVPASLTDAGSFTVLRRQLEQVNKLLKPGRLFFSHDEIRVANWSADEQQADRSAGELLATNVRRCRELAREVVPGASVAIWSDMFDPHHNAVDPPFYLVRGTLKGSWEGLDKQTLVINWNSGKPAESTRFFAERGHFQVLAGFYDAPVANIRTWLDKSRGNSVTGVMYTTWTGDFTQLEAFAKAAWGHSGVNKPNAR